MNYTFLDKLFVNRLKRKQGLSSKFDMNTFSVFGLPNVAGFYLHLNKNMLDDVIAQWCQFSLQIISSG